jgi:hypothetical protein
MNMKEQWTRFWNRVPLGERSRLSSALPTPVTDEGAWRSLSGRGHDHNFAAVQEQYADALSAWRRNPLAWRITAITSDYILGDHILISSPQRNLRSFIAEFWNHPKNRLDNRLEAMCDELTRAGDLFVLLFRNQQDGMSYIRFVTKDRIQRIETAPNDWETEIAYYETQDMGEPLRWQSAHTAKGDESAVMLHYAINRPLGALLGESDLSSMLPWLLRYARMLEDRVRLHWAVRSFLWMVTVPGSRIREKQQQYAVPPESGSVVIKDEGETWQAVAPDLHASDAQADLKAVRGMIDAGSGYPPHWRGEAADANLATATAMQAPTERHLARRQQYFLFILQDILYHAYQRAAQSGRLPTLRTTDYARLFTIQAPDISRTDNESLARAAKLLAETFDTLVRQFPDSDTLARLLLDMTFKASGNPLPDDLLDKIMAEANPQ